MASTAATLNLPLDQSPVEQPAPTPAESNVGQMLQDAMNTWDARKSERKRRR